MNIFKREQWEHHPEIGGQLTKHYRRNAISVFLDRCTEVKEITPGHRRDNRHMRHAITGIDFDPHGTNFATVDVDGFLSINDVSSLYERSLNSRLPPILPRPKFSHFLDIQIPYNGVRWNPADYRVVTVSDSSSILYLFDLNAQRPIIPTEIETYRPGRDPCRQCLTDIALPDKHSIIAAGKEGSLFFLDDRRAHSIKHFNVCPNDRINSIEMDPGKQVVFAATESYRICGMDVRALREPPHQNAYLLNISVEDELRASNKVKVPVFPLVGILEGVHCIKLDPSCYYNLGFTLTYGWSGIVDLRSSKITKMFCPPAKQTDCRLYKKSTWLPNISVYAVGESANSGLDLVNFAGSSKFLVPSEMTKSIAVKDKRRVLCCAADPTTSTVVAGADLPPYFVISK